MPLSCLIELEPSQKEALVSSASFSRLAASLSILGTMSLDAKGLGGFIGIYAKGLGGFIGIV